MTSTSSRPNHIWLPASWSHGIQWRSSARPIRARARPPSHLQFGLGRLQIPLRSSLSFSSDQDKHRRQAPSPSANYLRPPPIPLLWISTPTGRAFERVVSGEGSAISVSTPHRTEAGLSGWPRQGRQAAISPPWSGRSDHGSCVHKMGGVGLERDGLLPRSRRLSSLSSSIRAARCPEGSHSPAGCGAY